MESKLLQYQVPHFFQLLEIFKEQKCAFDASDTGTGKTFVALALAHELGMIPFVICPKTVIGGWISAGKILGVDFFGIANYEMLMGCNYYTPNHEKVDCPYIEKFKILDPNDKNPNINEVEIVEDYCFFLPDNVIVIFDEVHRCKNFHTITSRLLLSACRSAKKLLLLSATISDKIEHFKPFGVVFGFYEKMNEYKSWLRKIKKEKFLYYKNKGFTDDQITFDIIHTKLFPRFGSRMRIKELGDLFPKNQVVSQSYMSSNAEEIQQQYMIIKDAYNELKSKWEKSTRLAKLIRARMKIEMLKVPIMLDIIEEALESNYSVVVFVNYTETLEYLAHYFDTTNVIHGSQTLEERQKCIDSFQSNKSNIIIVNIRAGGVGISLHDIHGGHPRMSVINPTWSGQDMQQALGRIHRAGSQSPSLQRIVFCAGTYEEKICTMIQQKLTNISSINDRDMCGPMFENEEFEELKEFEDDKENDPDNDLGPGPDPDTDLGHGSDADLNQGSEEKKNNKIKEKNKIEKKYNKIVKKELKKTFVKKVLKNQKDVTD